MGQSSSQRRVQHQDVELWELCDDKRSSERGRRSKSTGRSRQSGSTARGSGRNSQSRNAARGEGRIRSTAANGRNAVNVPREIDDRIINSITRSNERRTERSRSSNDNKRVRVQGDPRRRTSQTTGRRPDGAGRSRAVSQTGCIQPYSSTAERRGNARTVYRGSARPVQSIKRRRARRRRELVCKAAIALLVVACLVMIYNITGQIYQMVHRTGQDKAERPLPAMAEQIFDNDPKIAPPEVTQDLLEINEYSRPGTKLDRINSIFVHYTANPGTSAAQNRSYFANLAETHERSASAHLIIGYEGEVIQCIPFDEQAYAVMTRNEDSISIECCFLSEDGSFTQETYDTLIHTLAWLLDEFDLSTDDILRHYDCGGKLCPLYYAENEGAWVRLRQDVADYMAEAE